MKVFKSGPDTYWNSYVGGIALGLVLTFALVMTGSGLGGSGGLARIVAGVTGLVAPDYTATNAVIAPWAAGGNNPFTHRMVFMTIGVLMGGFVSGALHGRLKIEARHGPRIGKPTRFAFAFLGGSITGFAARLARGCTAGQALSGGAVLSAGSWAFMMMVFVGGYLLAWPVRRLWT